MPLSAALKVAEGQICWRYDTPVPGQSESTSKTASRPTLLFIHAAVADHTLWDDQVTYCTAKGWHCLRYDLFGYGQSWVGKDYLAQNPRPPVRHHEHATLVVKALFSNPLAYGQRTTANQQVIVIGLSHGANIAVDFALSHPELVSGLILCAGGLGGLEVADTPAEEAMFARVDELMEKKDAVNAAKMNVRIWGDGTQAEEGRLNQGARERLFSWCKDIAEKELNGEGGKAIPFADLSDPPAVERLSDIKVETMIAIGKYDVSSTNTAMRYAAQHIKNATLKEFEAAHMINLDSSTDFNDRLGAYLRSYHDSGEL